MPHRHPLVRAVARREGAELVDLIADALAPWPVTVHYLEDYATPTLRVILGAHDGPRLDIPVDAANLAGRIPGPELAHTIAAEVRRRWHVLDPADVPTTITLGQD